jgi:hypothetical protein
MSITGVTSDNIVSMNASKLTGALPVADGSSLTGITAFTTNASDPAIDINPSGGVGTIWLNTTSGEMYALTDATAGSNVWTNIGAGTGDVGPWLPYRATISGYHTGGVPNTNTIEKYSFVSDGNSTNHGALSITFRINHSGQSSETHGYTSGGDAGVDVIDKFAFAGSSVTATDVGNLTVGRDASAGGQMSETHGYVSGGSGSNVIDKFPFATDTNATDHGDLTVARYYISGQSSQTHGYTSGGHPANQDVIDKFSFAGSSVSATDVGNLTGARGLTSGQSSTTHGYVSGGYTSSTAIDKFSFASDGNATSVGSLVSGGQSHGGASSTTHGYEAGGYVPASNHTTIEKFTFASDADATTVGNLITARRYGAGNQV